MSLHYAILDCINPSTFHERPLGPMHSYVNNAYKGRLQQHPLLLHALHSSHKQLLIFPYHMSITDHKSHCIHILKYSLFPNSFQFCARIYSGAYKKRKNTKHKKMPSPIVSLQPYNLKMTLVFVTNMNWSCLAPGYSEDFH